MSELWAKTFPLARGCRDQTITVKQKDAVCAGATWAFQRRRIGKKAAKTRMGKYLTKMERQRWRGFISQSLLQLRVKTAMDIGAEAGRFSGLAGNGRLGMVSIGIDGYALRCL